MRQPIGNKEHHRGYCEHSLDNDEAKSSPCLLDVLVGTTLGAGFWPWGPGTAGAAVGVAVWVAYHALLPSFAWTQVLTLLLAVVFTLVSIRPINRLEKYWGADPSRVVIDETVGVWITLLAVPESCEWYYVAAAFVLFRFMDIVKPLGCRWLDNNIHGGWGVMLDDVLAGIYGAVVLWGITLL